MPAKSKLQPRIWELPVYLPYLQPRLTPKAIAAAEATLGVTLPTAYLNALRVQNGGYIRRRVLPRAPAPVDCIAGIGPRYPSILNHDWTTVKSYMAEEGIKKPARIDKLFSFCGDGHFHFCLDYRKCDAHGEPRITYIDVECFNVDKAVAPDFGTFLEKLTTEEDSEVLGLRTTASIKTVAAAISRVGGYPLADQGSQSHGYTVYRGQLPGRYNWLWLTPNRVRRGFIRKSDPDYAKLHELLPGDDLRFPEHADCDYFLKCDFESDAGRTLRSKLQALPFLTRMLRLGGT